MNIITVISDTFRQDHLPCYGNEKIIAPRLGAFAKDSIIFDNCYAASFPTVPARADIFTGKFTFTYLEWGPLPLNERPLAQLLSQAGYLSCGITDNPFMIRNGYGFDRGFDDFIWIRGQRHGAERADVIQGRPTEEECFAPRTFKTAIEWLERHHNDNFFLYIDTWDPHEPWNPPSYYAKPYLPDYAGELVDPTYWEWEECGYTQRDVDIAHACYCGEITMVDRWFGMLLDRLDTLGLLEETVIIFTSDHGFYFGERGILGKRRFRFADRTPFEQALNSGRRPGYSYRSPMHNEITRVPLLMHIPNLAPRRIPGLATLPDLMPTILDLSGVLVPDSVQSSSLLPLVRGEAKAVHDFVVTSVPLESLGSESKTVDDAVREIFELTPSTISTGDWDMLYSAAGEPVELYRSKEDPRHERNVANENMDVVKRIHAQFISWLEELGTAEHLIKPRRTL